MARPKIKGLLYFPFDIDFFEDNKIRIVKARYRSDGVMIYLFLLCEIYRQGYYIKADEDFFGGSLIPENRWISLELKMSARLNQYTFDRMKEDNWPEQAKTALCEMCDCAYKYERREGKISENNDGYSVSYDTSKPLNVMLYEIAEVYLINAGLMSLAVDDDVNECNDNYL